MVSGKYEFSVFTTEHMTVTSGEMKVQIPGKNIWNTHETFIVDKGVSFKVKITD